MKLADYVYIIIIPSEYRKQIMEVLPEQLLDRAFCLGHDKLVVWQWPCGQKRYIPLCMIWQKVRLIR